MRIVSRYLLSQFALSTALSFAVLAITAVSMDVLLHIDDFGDDAQQALRGVLRVALDLIPHAVPLSAVVGVVWSLSRAVRFREITAIRCGGIPLRSALLPILIACVVLAGVLALIEDRLIVPARQALQAEDGATGGDRPPIFTNGRWWFATGASVFSAADWEPDSSTLVDVTVFEFDASQRLRRRIDAGRSSFLHDKVWEFERATVRDFERASDVRLEQVGNLRLDLGLSGAEVARALPAVESTSLHRLARGIRERQGDTGALALLESEFHRRLGQALWTLILVLLAIPVAIGDVERGDSLPRALLLSIGLAAAFWLCWTAGVFSARSGLLPPAIPAWGVTIAFLALGTWRFRALRE